MRPTPVDADDMVRFHPPPSPPCHDHRACSWRPYSNSSDFEANAAVIVIILLCGLICALALNTAIRCFLRGRPEHDPDPIDDVEPTPVKVVPTVVFSAEMAAEMAGAAAAECAICLSEFMEGEEVQIMGSCRHGFHVQCIREWLTLHSSCPTCRRTYHSLSPPETPSL